MHKYNTYKEYIYKADFTHPEGVVPLNSKEHHLNRRKVAELTNTQRQIQGIRQNVEEEEQVPKVQNKTPEKDFKVMAINMYTVL